MIPLESLEYLMRCCSQALSDITDEDRGRLADLILSAKRIFIFGVGRSGLVGQTFAIRLVQLGLQVYFVGDMTTPILRKDDFLLLISNTGKTISVVTTAQIARRIGTHVACVTSDRDSKLAQNSDTVLLVHSADRKVDSEMAPLGTVFEDAKFLFFDTIVPDLMRRLGRSETDMRNNHAIWV
ncbi:MAG: SIS domain-containing protein [archaeon]|nr:SIS domain-containing protein [archaeon]